MNIEISTKATEIELNWEAAKLYCFALNTNNKTGWRLPTKEELNQIFHSDNDFENPWYYWCTDNGLPDTQNFHNCYQLSYDKHCEFWVRAVRDV